MTIAEVSRKYALSQDTLRYYERIGMIPSVNRTQSGLRNYTEQDCRWIELAKCMTTVSGTNIREIPDIIDTVVKYGADVFAFTRYCPTGEEKDTGMTPQEYQQLLDVCFRKFQKCEEEGCGTYFSRKDHLWTLYEYEKGIFKIPEDAEEGMIYGGCNCGNCHLTILPTGDLYA